jgi:hypothetical protein
MPRYAAVKGRESVTKLFDHSYQIRNVTGIGVFSPQYGPRRAIYGGLKIPLAALMGSHGSAPAP